MKILVPGVIIFLLIVVGVAYMSSKTSLNPMANSTEETSQVVTGRFPQASAGTLEVARVSGQVSAGAQSVPVTVSFPNPGETISGLAMRLTYQGKESDGLSVSNMAIAPEISGDSSWVCPIKKSRVVNGLVTVDLACLNTSPTGYTAAGETELASFNLTRTNGQFNGPVQMKLDPEVSAMVKKSDGGKITLQ